MPETNEPIEQPALAGAPAGTVLRRPKPPAGVPVWRTGKPDAVLAAAVDAARAGVQTVARPEEIGGHVAAKSEGDRVVTHLFESRLPGYVGWHWFAVVTRLARSKVVTVSEVGLIPSEKSLLAPEWVPWAERVRPEDEQEHAAEETSAEEGADEETIGGEETTGGEGAGGAGEATATVGSEADDREEADDGGLASAGGRAPRSTPDGQAQESVQQPAAESEGH